MKKHRKHYTPEEKVAILRRHLLEQVPISELCDKQGFQPTLFYRWQKEFFENGAAAFQPKAGPNHSAEQERIAYLEKKIHVPTQRWRVVEFALYRGVVCRSKGSTLSSPEAPAESVEGS